MSHALLPGFEHSGLSISQNEASRNDGSRPPLHPLPSPTRRCIRRKRVSTKQSADLTEKSCVLCPLHVVTRVCHGALIASAPSPALFMWIATHYIFSRVVVHKLVQFISGGPVHGVSSPVFRPHSAPHYCPHLIRELNGRWIRRSSLRPSVGIKMHHLCPCPLMLIQTQSATAISF
jgi:hypothetical protein